MSGTKPAILIVHGGYQLPDTWSHFIDTLQAAGFQARCHRLSTCGDTRPPKASLADDVITIRNVAIELASSGHSIIVLAHSYGGIVASEAITPDLYGPPHHHNSKTGAGANPGGVIHMIYLSAWLVLKGQSLNDIVQKHGFQSRVDVGFNEDGTAHAKNAVDSFYNNIEPRSRAEELARASVTHNWNVVSCKVECAPWLDLPTTYVFCERDQAILLDLQVKMVRDAREVLVVDAARDIETETLGTGHCPFLSMPEKVLGIVEKVAAGL